MIDHPRAREAARMASLSVLTSRRRAALVLLLSAALGLAACGESDQEKAQKQVCDARADISKQVDEIKSLTPATATVDGVRQNVNAIQDDLKDIVNAQKTLSDDRRQQVKSATDQFTQQLSSIVQQALRSLSVSDAKTQLQSAVSDLASAYSSSLGKIDC
jgi:chromosome segregation ATPase